MTGSFWRFFGIFALLGVVMFVIFFFLGIILSLVGVAGIFAATAAHAGAGPELAWSSAWPIQPVDGLDRGLDLDGVILLALRGHQDVRKAWT